MNLIAIVLHAVFLSDEKQGKDNLFNATFNCSIN